MNFCANPCDAFPVDLGIDLTPIRQEIEECKRRYHKELWEIICRKVVTEEDEGWKKSRKSGNNSASARQRQRRKSDDGNSNSERPQAGSMADNRRQQSHRQIGNNASGGSGSADCSLKSSQRQPVFRGVWANGAPANPKQRRADKKSAPRG